MNNIYYTVVVPATLVAGKSVSQPIIVPFDPQMMKVLRVTYSYTDIDQNDLGLYILNCDVVDTPLAELSLDTADNTLSFDVITCYDYIYNIGRPIRSNFQVSLAKVDGTYCNSGVVNLLIHLIFYREK